MGEKTNLWFLTCVRYRSAFVRYVDCFDTKINQNLRKLKAPKISLKLAPIYHFLQNLPGLILQAPRQKLSSSRMSQDIKRNKDKENVDM